MLNTSALIESERADADAATLRAANTLLAHITNLAFDPTSALIAGVDTRITNHLVQASVRAARLLIPLNPFFSTKAGSDQ